MSVQRGFVGTNAREFEALYFVGTTAYTACFVPFSPLPRSAARGARSPAFVVDTDLP
jgi:hypothetical protein